MRSISLRDRIASVLGCVCEWYDFSLFGFFVPAISVLFFPGSDIGSSFLKSFSVFALGFIARPAGAILLGYVSDKYGRTKCLRITPLLITIPTFLISLLPTYETIGFLAPTLLVILRFAQGLSIGGEHANNMIYLCESSKERHRFFFGSLASCSGSLGIFLASAVSGLCYYLLSDSDVLLFGWRIAFSLSLVLGLVTFFMRLNMRETDDFLETRKGLSECYNPIKDSYHSQKGDYLTAIGIVFLPATSFYYTFVYLPSHLSSFLGVNTSVVLGETSVFLLIRLAIIPLVGIMADKYGGRLVASVSCFLFIFIAPALLYGISQNDTYLFLYVLSLALLTTLNAGTTPGLLVHPLKPRTRSTILSLSFNLCFGIFGGLVPIISHQVYLWTGDMTIMASYLILTSLITLISLKVSSKESSHVVLQKG